MKVTATSRALGASSGQVHISPILDGGMPDTVQDQSCFFGPRELSGSKALLGNEKSVLVVSIQATYGHPGNTGPSKSELSEQAAIF
jgi:hypothetical protein